MRFVGKRLALFVAALVGLSALVFVMLRVLPGDVAAVIAGTNATPERIASLRAEFGLDKPLVAQYGDWMAGMLHGDLGVSTVGGRPVARQIAMRAAVTFPLIVLSLLIALAIGLPLGCAAVLTRNPRLRGLFHGIALAQVAGAQLDDVISVDQGAIGLGGTRLPAAGEVKNERRVLCLEGFAGLDEHDTFTVERLPCAYPCHAQA